MLNSLGPVGIILIVMVAFLIYGPKKLPEMGKTVGQTIKSFKGGLIETKEQIVVETEKENKEENKLEG
ncbi:twin-arginine translocase TatA/TatE family subunit [Fictibacillus phosphorivorans]|uniref:twin-arginine translocase TatA/TatE family subunit n=1 Tax=Fictibacillus phosphorivorans TaxID=1221500 RepID=UPI00203AFDDE|nr:twin-arginine translocase TatA/TatE family subunit [Fictibacillus phosphorivorans]MCM3719444.1 twin-arginine translocase TatA/TatE family subunit [Fictibacillus phosphorivorans]MCM3777078.1 twin-arginine translocase TatA/TatE family subunit [Fictibacillus phosphorivorans]